MAQPECIAEAGGGRYLATASSIELASALVEAASLGSPFVNIQLEVLTRHQSSLNEVYTVRVRALDPEADALTFTWTSNHGSISPQEESFDSWPDFVPAQAAWDLSDRPDGSYTINVRVSDGEHAVGAQMSVEVTGSTVVIAPPNQPPVILEGPPRDLEGAAGIFTIRLVVQDPDGNAVRVEFSPFVSAVDEPVQTSEASGDPAAFEADWDLTGFNPGRYLMNISVSDVRDGDDERGFGMQLGVTVTD